MSACSPQAESQRFQGHDGQPARDGRRRSWPHRNTNYTAIHDVEWLQKRHDWPGLQGVIMVEREINGRITKETRFYIPDLAGQRDRTDDPRSMGGGNCLHWVMDMVCDGECRVRTENAPANFTTLKHMGQNLIKKITRQGLAAFQPAV
jgi:hypothetical protein